MMVAASDRRAVAYITILCEALSVLLIAVAIIAPVSAWARLFIVVAISYAASIRSAGVVEADLKKDEALQSLWHSHLTLRTGIDSMLEQVQAGNRPVSIDWRSASAAAVDDIKLAREDERLREELGGSRTIEFILAPIFLIGWLAARVALGWALGFGLLAVFPSLAHQ